MKNTGKYVKQYFPVKESKMRWAEKDSITKAPKWCSVDLRDGNQSLIVPMDLEEKLDFFRLLIIQKST